MDIYPASQAFVHSCYQLTKRLPMEEKYGMTSQIRRAASSVHLNIAEGSSRRSIIERKRYYEISRGSIIEIDAALDIANGLGYLKNIDMDQLGEKMIKCFKILSGMISAK